MLQVLQEDIENSQQLSSQSLKNTSYLYNQMKKINGNKSYAISSILLNQNYEQENAIIVDLTFRSLSHEIDSKLIQEFHSLRHIIEPHQIHYQSIQQSPFQINKACSICMNQMDVPVKIEPCSHIFCQKCVTLYLYNKIMSGQVTKITCPMFECQSILNDSTIKQHIHSDIYQKYQRFLLIKQYEHVVNGKWCPRAECFNFVYQQGSSKVLSCKCGQEFCFDCGNPVHPNRTCEESVDQAFAEAIRNLKIQKCPNCKSNIIKNGGCNHMCCTQCHYDFCWLCRCKFSSHHYDWMNPFSCPGEQYQEREPYSFPKILICLRAIIKLMIYVLLSPILAIAGVGLLLYGIGYLISRIIIRCSCLRDCLNDICC